MVTLVDQKLYILVVIVLSRVNVSQVVVVNRLLVHIVGGISGNRREYAIKEKVTI